VSEPLGARRIGAIGLALAAVAVLLMTAALTSAHPARQRHPARRPGAPYLALGFVDDPLFETTPPATERHFMGTAAHIGSTWVRLSVLWSEIAPAVRPAGFKAADPGDPHYDWAPLDASVRAAAAAHEHILLTVYSAPAWALGKGPPHSFEWKPSPFAFGAFAAAVARRYSGHYVDRAESPRPLPAAGALEAWNEPNLPTSLQPQWVRHGKRFFAFSPGWYRRLLNAFYGAVKRVLPHVPVLAAGLAPYGDPPGGPRMRPVTFLEGVLCLNGRLRPLRCPGPAHLDGIDDHPYSINPTVHAFNVDDTSVPDVHRLSHVLAVAVARHRALPHGPKQTWVSEIEWPSDPPRPHAPSLAVQARYLDYCFYNLWAQGVTHIFWFTLSDRDTDYVDQVPGSGVFFASGAPKPAARAYAFPFVALPGARSSLTLWGRAPHPGRVVIAIHQRAGWRVLRRLSTTRGGIFFARTRVRLPPGALLRATVGRMASLPWRAVLSADGALREPTRHPAAHRPGQRRR
jgi:hypothetical protein